MKKQLFAFLIAVGVLAASPALAAVTVYTPGIDGTDAYMAFSAQYGTLQTETFESFSSPAYLDQPINSYGGLDIAFGKFTSTSQNGAGYIASKASIQGGTGETPIDTLYLSNGDPTSRTGTKGDLTLTLDGSYRALGFYATDWHDVGGSVELVLNGEGWTDTVTIEVRDYIGNLDSDTMVYFSFYSDLAFNSVIFKASGQDGYGIDNLSVGAPTPIPGAAWLLGSGLIGLVGLRRRFV